MVSRPLLALAADLVVILHFASILFIVFGGLLVFRSGRWAYVHLPFAAWGAIIEFMGWICPLTPLEQYLRQASGAAAYRGGFVEHYLLPLIYPENLTRDIQILLGLLVLAVNLLIYGIWLTRARKAG